MIRVAVARRLTLGRFQPSVRLQDFREVIASLRQLSPVLVQPPAEIRYLLMRRFTAVASANLALSLALLAVVLAIYGRDAPLPVLAGIWFATAIGYVARERLRARTLHRVEVDGSLPRSADRWYEWLPRLSVVAWSITPLLLMPWVSSTNLLCLSYAAVGVVAMTAVSNVAALPACVFFLTSNGSLIVGFLCLQGSVHHATLAALVALTVLTVLDRIVGLHRTLVKALVAERDKARLVHELQLHHDALASENRLLGRSLLTAARAAHHDPLTGLRNRRYLDEWLPSMRRRVETGDEQIALCVVDVDHFKGINDQFGHPVGDEVLRVLSELLLGQLREDDCLVRLGGEEFLAVLRFCDLCNARRIAESIRTHVAAGPVVTTRGCIDVRVSVGTADWRYDETFEDVYARADRALYRAKNSGRDKVIVDGMASRPAELSDFVPPNSLY